MLHQLSSSPSPSLPGEFLPSHLEVFVPAPSALGGFAPSRRSPSRPALRFPKRGRFPTLIIFLFSGSLQLTWSKPRTPPREPSCHEAVSPVTAAPRLGTRGCSAGSGHRQRAVPAAARAARFPVRHRPSQRLEKQRCCSDPWLEKYQNQYFPDQEGLRIPEIICDFNLHLFSFFF